MNERLDLPRRYLEREYGVLVESEWSKVPLD